MTTSSASLTVPSLNARPGFLSASIASNFLAVKSFWSGAFSGLIDSANLEVSFNSVREALSSAVLFGSEFVIRGFSTINLGRVTFGSFAFASWYSLKKLSTICAFLSNFFESFPKSSRVKDATNASFSEIRRSCMGTYFEYPGMDLASEKDFSSSLVAFLKPYLLPSPCTSLSLSLDT